MNVGDVLAVALLRVSSQLRKQALYGALTVISIAAITNRLPGDLLVNHSHGVSEGIVAGTSVLPILRRNELAVDESVDRFAAEQAILKEGLRSQIANRGS